MHIPKDVALATAMTNPPSAYSQKLKDPRWQRKRLKVLERDKFQCQLCGDTKKTLNVHHIIYLPNQEPWDCPDDFLLTLCEVCHKKEAAEWMGTTFLLGAAAKMIFRFAETARDFAISVMWWMPTLGLNQSADTGIFISLIRYLASHPKERQRLAKHILATDGAEYQELSALLKQGKD